MGLLIDGNNLLYALAEVDRQLSRAAMCEVIHLYCQAAGTSARVVFDGPEPLPDVAAQIAAQPDVAVSYAAPRSADEIIVEQIAADSAPKRLVVVSTDRQIRKAARRRKCQSVRSEHFAARIQKTLNQPPAPRPVEPEEKRKGLAPEQTRRWLREFGYEPPDDEAD
jgi:predicted RNA-binding protein with PIN domain